VIAYPYSVWVTKVKVNQQDIESFFWLHHKLVLQIDFSLNFQSTIHKQFFPLQTIF